MISSRRGATMVEYAVLLAFIAVVCIVLIASLGSSTNGLFAPINSNWNGV